MHYYIIDHTGKPLRGPLRNRHDAEEAIMNLRWILGDRVMRIRPTLIGVKGK